MFKNRVGSKYSCPEIEAATVICHGSLNLFQKSTVMCYPLAQAQDLDKVEHRIRLQEMIVDEVIALEDAFVQMLIVFKDIKAKAAGRVAEWFKLLRI